MQWRTYIHTFMEIFKHLSEETFMFVSHVLFKTFKNFVGIVTRRNCYDYVGHLSILCFVFIVNSTRNNNLLSVLQMQISRFS